jgi:hypothetical protein
MHVTIYARFSSDLQDVRSIADQVDLAWRYAENRRLRRSLPVMMRPSPVPRRSTALVS